MVHELKILPKYFEKVIKMEKKFEIRKDDRNFKVGDFLKLKEFNGEYTGRDCVVEVTYKMNGGEYGLEKGFCVMSIERMIWRNKNGK